MRGRYLLPMLALALLLICGVAAAEEQSELPELRYNVGSDQPQTGVVIAVLRPVIHFAGDPLSAEARGGWAQFQRIAHRNRFGAEARLALKMAEGHRFLRRFQMRYAPQLRKALAQGVRDLFANSGFTVRGVFTDYEALVAQQREQIFALSAVQTTMAVTDTLESRQCNDYRCVRRGTIQVDAQVLMQLADAASGYTATFRRSHLYGSDIHQSYVIERAVAPDGLWQRVKRWFRTRPPLRDTSDDALAKLTAEVFEQIMARMDHMISTQRARLVGFGQARADHLPSY